MLAFQGLLLKAQILARLYAITAVILGLQLHLIKAVARKFPREGPNQEKGIASGASEKIWRFFFVLVKILNVRFYRGIKCGFSSKITAVIA